MKQLNELPRKGNGAPRNTWVPKIFSSAKAGRPYELVAGEDFPEGLKVPASAIRRFATVNGIKVAIRNLEGGNIAIEVAAAD